MVNINCRMKTMLRQFMYRRGNIACSRVLFTSMLTWQGRESGFPRSRISFRSSSRSEPTVRSRNTITINSSRERRARTQWSRPIKFAKNLVDHFIVTYSKDMPFIGYLEASRSFKDFSLHFTKSLPVVLMLQPLACPQYHATSI